MKDSIKKWTIRGLITLEALVGYTGCQVGNGRPPEGRYTARPDTSIHRDLPTFIFYGQDSTTFLWNGLSPSIVFKDSSTGKMIQVYENHITITEEDSLNENHII